MSDQTEALALLRRIDAKVDSLAGDVRELARRMARVEESLPGVNRRLDGLEERMIRIERHVDLAVATQQGHAT